MKNPKIITIDGGSAEYWRQRTHGFYLIRQAERAAENLASAPAYIAGAWTRTMATTSLSKISPRWSGWSRRSGTSRQTKPR